MEESIEKLFYQTEEAEKKSSPLRIPKSYDAINEIEEQILSSLDGENKKRFIQFSNMYSELLAQEKLDAFERGVRVGGNI